MTTTESMKLIGQKNDSRLDTVVPKELKRLVVEQADKENTNLSLWVKIALVEKLERDTQAQ